MEVAFLGPSLIAVLMYLLLLFFFIYLITSFLVSHRRQAQAQEKMAHAQAEIAKHLANRLP